MKVLVLVYDLYAGRVVGGGETFYRNLIAAYPGIHFHYPSLAADRESPPTNAHPVQVGATYLDNPSFDTAATFAGQHFDVIDLPDFQREGLLFLEAFRQLGGTADTIALSLHGRASTNWRVQWEPASAKVLADEDANDRLMYRYVDVRYGISRAYIDELTSREGHRCHYLNPLPLYGFDTTTLSVAAGDSPPTLLMVGRTNRNKGPDLFVDIVSNIPRALYAQATIIGSHPAAAPSRLGDMAFRRGIDIDLPGSLSHEDVLALFRRRCLLLVLSRAETLSLVAIEALLQGCPTVIAPHLGVARALDDCYPGIPHLRVDPAEPVAAAAAIAALLQDYDRHRGALVDHLRTHAPIIEGSSLVDIYAAPHDHDAPARAELGIAIGVMLAQARRASPDDPVRRPPPATEESPGPGVVGVSTPPLQSRLSDEKCGQLFRLWAGEVPKWMKTYAELAAMPETTDSECDRKWQFLGNSSPAIMLDRVRRTRALARIERLRGRSLTAAAYELRVLRWLGTDRFEALPEVVATLDSAGYGEEARAADLMFGEQPNRDGATLDYLRSRLNRFAAPVPDFATLVDGRVGDRDYRAAVIVSLYNAADKLPRFLRALTTQTAFRQGRLEVILVDSGSPRDEQAALRATLGAHPEHILFVRTKARETIQCAWNRGITLARAPYLLFLGVDEEIRPDAVDCLADALDQSPSVDWVQASAVVLSVNTQGVLERDSGAHDRKWANGDAQYVDTTYLGHVAGLYRKSLHDRVGLYDPLFRGAGDTEFKNRALPFMKTRTLPLVLGRYINYPEDRTTHSCGVEIEDLRAWYLHRTPAGLRYAFGDRPIADLENLVSLALQHQKCYRRHVSSDADLAVLATDLLAERDPASALLQFRDGSHGLQEAWRRADLLFGDWPIERAEWIGPELLSREILAIGGSVARIARAHGWLRGLGIAEDYHFLNDNRCEQHHWVWNS